MKTVQDMTKGWPPPIIIRFAAPILLTSILQQLYSLADGMIAGRFLGVNAFAAISAAGFIAWLPQNMLLGLTHGFSVVMSQLFGAGDREEFRKGAIRSALLSCGASLVFLAVLAVMCEKWMILMRFPAELHNPARNYLLIIYAGLPFFALFNWAASVLRAQGDSRTPFWAMFLSSAVNIVLDYVFVVSIPMGVAGPSLSTVIGQILAFLYCFTALCFRKPHFPARSDKRVEGSVRQLMYMGFLPMLRDGVIAIGGLFVQSVVNGFGVLFVGGMAAANRFFSVISMSAGCFEGAVGTFCGQNFGAGKYDRIRRGVRSTVWLSLALAALTMLVTWFSAPFLIRLIVGPAETEMLSIGVCALRWSIWFLPALHLLFIFRPAIQGMGSSVTPLLSGFAELAMRLFSVFVLASCMGYTSAYIADGLGWVLASLLLAARYVVCIRKSANEICSESHCRTMRSNGKQ